ncbi:hypothetical protein GCM10028807_12430 [Spirosoma daeguense]
MKKLFLLLGSAILFSCEKPFCEETSDQTAGLVIRVLDRKYLAYDTSTGDLSRFGIKVSNEQQYQRVFAHCCESRLDTIDFEKFDILGLTTVNRGNSSGYLLDVKRDDSSKKIIYTVTEHYCERSSPVDGRSNFVVVPKLPADYQVEYVRNQ